jgi:hypothetical protein
MVDSLELASDVVTGGTALGGFQKEQQGPVRARHQAKAWLAVVGLFFSLGSAGAAIIGKWLNIECAATTAIVFLIIALLWGCLVAVLSAKEIH